VLYDFANTCYSLIVITVFFTPFIKDVSGSNEPLGYATAASMLLAGLLVPIAGAISDRTNVTKRCLVSLTLVSCAATASLAVPTGTAALVVLFFLANVTYQLGLVFYNSLLPDVADREHVDSVNGWGVGVGYLGSLFALAVGIAVERAVGTRGTFVAAGALFFAFSVPLFLFVREREVDHPAPISRRLLAEAFSRLARTLRDLPKTPALLLFLAGNFLAVDALNTMIQFINETLRDFLGIADATTRYAALISLQATAFPFGILAGAICRRKGGHVAYLAAIGALLGAVAACAVGRPLAITLPAIVAFGGFGVGGIWVAGRRLVYDLAPSDRIGEFFGLYGLTQKTSATGALLFGILTTRASHWHALALLAAYLVVAAALISLARARSAPATPRSEGTPAA
jgi:UMF1 family MFS transporter